MNIKDLIGKKYGIKIMDKEGNIDPDKKIYKNITDAIKLENVSGVAVRLENSENYVVISYEDADKTLKGQI